MQIQQKQQHFWNQRETLNLQAASYTYKLISLDYKTASYSFLGSIVHSVFHIINKNKIDLHTKLLF